MRALGITTAQVNTAGKYTAQANAIAQNLGAKPTNETFNSITDASAKIAAIAAVIPGGQVIAAVSGVVAVAAQFLSSIFGGGPSTADRLRDLRAGNDLMRAQIKTIDDQTMKINQALITLQNSLVQNGLAGVEEDIAMQSEASATDPLQQQLATKGHNLQVLIETFNQTIKQTYSAIYGKKQAQSIVLYALLAVGVGAVIYAIIPTKKTNG